MKVCVSFQRLLYYSISSAIQFPTSLGFRKALRSKFGDIAAAAQTVNDLAFNRKKQLKANNNVHRAPC